MPDYSISVQQEKFKTKTGINFSNFYQSNFNKLIYFNNKICWDYQLSQDVASDTFMHILNMIDSYDPTKSSSKTYLYTISQNLLFQRKNKLKNQISIDSPFTNQSSGYTVTTFKDYLADNSSEIPYNISYEMATNAKADIIRKHIPKLPDTYRIVIEKRELENMSYQKIADELNLNLSTLKSRIKGGRTLLRKMIKKEFKQMDISLG